MEIFKQVILSGTVQIFNDVKRACMYLPDYSDSFIP